MVRVQASDLAAARRRLDAGRAALELEGAVVSDGPGRRLPRCDRGFGGLDRAERVTALFDEVVARLAALAPVPGLPVALVALGGYGRRELALRSDLDLMFLTEDPEAAAPFVEAVLYALWDLGVEVGHAVRTPDTALGVAEAEPTVLSGLLDARLLAAGAGDAEARRSLFQRTGRGLDALLSRPDVARALVGSKLDEAARRRARYGETVYLLEPNVKESAGGLRDLHGALWVSRVRFKVHGLDELLRLGVLSPAEHRTLTRAYDFLLRVRFELHRITGRRQDHLRFQHQERIAPILGFLKEASPDPDQLAHGVERFMRAYYFHARSVRVLGNNLVEQAIGPRPPRDRNGRPAPGGFRWWGGQITVTGVDHFHRDPSALVRIFEVAAAEGAELHPHAKHLVFEQRTFLDAKARRDRRVVDPFLSLLEDPRQDGRVFEQMHDLGLLKKILPELSRVTSRWQHSLYHVYTVDVHSLKVLDIAKRFRRGDLREAHPELTRVIEDLPRPAVLYLACLLHDVGKGWRGESHSVRGAKVAAAVGKRLEEAASPGWGAEDTSDLVWLVEDHLIMSDLSQRRDISDPALVAQFARTVRTEERLDMLHLLTVCDMMGTSPKVFTGWKAALLRELSAATREMLRGESDGQARRHLAARRKRAEAALLEEIAGEGALAAEARLFFEAVPDRYLLSTPANRVARHVRMWSGVRRRGGLATHVQHLRRQGVSELTVACPDRPGLLALLAGVLAAHDLSILSASVFSVDAPKEQPPPAPPGQGDFELTPGARPAFAVALDVLAVTSPTGGLVDDPDRWARVRADLARILIDGVEPALLIHPRLHRSPGLETHRPAVKTEVRVVPGVGDEVVFDVFCEDHIGVLWRIAHTLAEHGLAITLAKISTQGHRVADGFYVRDEETGARVNNPDRLQTAAKALRAALEQGFDRMPVP